MSEHDVVWSDRGTITDGPTVGLASYELRDPESTFRLIGRSRPRRVPRPPGAGSWALRLLVVWAANLAALVAAGLVVTSVGATDPLAYVVWAAVFGVVNLSLPLSARLAPRLRAMLVVATALFVVDVLLVGLMTLLARPFHSPGLADFAIAGGVMWAANLPLGVLHLRRRAPAAPRELA